MAGIAGLVTPSGDPDDWIVTAHDAETHAFGGVATVVEGAYTISGLEGGRPYLLVFRPLTGKPWAATSAVDGLSICSPLAPVATPYLYRSGAGDAHGGKVGLLLHMDGDNNGTTFTDTSAFAHALTRTNAVTKTDVQKVGLASGYFAGNSSLTASNHASLAILDKAFTLEAWVYANSLSTPVIPYDRTSGTWGLSYEHVFLVKATALDVYYGTRGTNQAMIRMFWPTTFTTGVWHHIEISRDSQGVWRAFLDGVISPNYQMAPLAGGLSFGALTAGSPTNTVNLGNTSIAVNIGKQGADSIYSNCYFDELRFTLGAVRHTSDFTPLTDAFPDPQVTGLSEPTWPTAVGGTVVDGGVTWTNVGRLARPLAHGPVIAI